jgi:hypothetical protein
MRFTLSSPFSSQVLNYLGVIIAALGMIPYAFVKSGGNEDE